MLQNNADFGNSVGGRPGKARRIEKEQLEYIVEFSFLYVNHLIDRPQGEAQRGWSHSPTPCIKGRGKNQLPCPIKELLGTGLRFAIACQVNGPAECLQALHDLANLRRVFRLQTDHMKSVTDVTSHIQRQQNHDRSLPQY